MTKQRILVFTLTAMLITGFVSVGTAHAKKSFWEAMLGPWLKDMDTGPKPEDTLQAPFSDNPFQVNEHGARKAHTLVPLSQPHMDHDTVGRWLMTAVAEAMTFRQNDTDEIIAARKAYFTDEAWNSAMMFSKRMGFDKVMDGNKYNVHSFVKTPPLLLNAMEHENRFRWLFEVPVMMSALDAEGFDYRELDAVNQEVMVVVQVGRYTVDESEDGILIETFQGRDDALRQQGR